MSTAKELIQAADEVVRNYQHFRFPAEWEQALVIADHILATVREDDDEPATDDWVRDVTGNTASIIAQETFTILLYSFHGMALQTGIPLNRTRGQMRHLFAALGIELKESA